MPDLRFPKRLRLLRGGEFRRVLDVRASASDGEILVYGARNDLGHPRLGLTVSRNVGKAVARNRWKRALREAFRLSQHELPPLDLVVFPRTAAEPSVRRIRDSLLALAARVAKKLGQADPRRSDPARPASNAP